jgi:hypothetical protein
MSERDIEVTGLNSRGADVLESPPRRPLPRRTLAAGVLAAIVAAGVGGYVAGGRHGTSRPEPAPSASVPAAALVSTGAQCSAQNGKRLQLGVEVRNPSATTVTLQRVRATIPLGGLRPVAQSWGSCGQLVPSVGTVRLVAGASTWLTMTFDVLEPCPAPLPVLFTIDYTSDGHPEIADVRGFNDLGDVPYTGGDCTTN